MSEPSSAVNASASSSPHTTPQLGLQRRRQRRHRPRGRGRGGRHMQRPRSGPPSQPPPKPPPSQVYPAASAVQTTELSTRLIAAMRKGEHECLVCLDRIKRTSQLWSCSVCHSITHLHCVRKWAKSDSPACPSCRTPLTNPTFRCYCGRRKAPVLEPGVTPGSCNETCLRSRGAKDSDCPHRCSEICHPGPCAPCLVPISKKCFCGSDTVVVRCGEVTHTSSCGGICGRRRICGHRCTRICHDGDCGDCEVVEEVKCFCGAATEQLPCGVPGFSCGKSCGRLLECGNHYCEDTCHDGPCHPCPTAPLTTTDCPCGARPLTAGEKFARTSCLSPIPTCDSPCGKSLNCLLAHPCQSPCGHPSPCPPCEKTPTVTCRCGATIKRVKCGDLKEVLQEQLLCDRKCNTRLPCRAHTCQTTCCPHRKRRPGKVKTPEGLFPVVPGHSCRRICEKPLSCGKHVCDLACGHSDSCPPCGILLREPLPCACGAVILPAPVRCGTRPPECNRRCSRTKACGHKCPLTCHSDECPPCVEIIKSSCLGGHESRYTPCHIGRLGIKCARVCGKPLKCGVHVCQYGCHAGECEESTAEGCRQKCGLKRKNCGHSCVQPCHPGLRCPEVLCRERIDVKCSCGRKTEKALCLRGGSAPPSGQVIQAAPVVDDVRLTCDQECDAQARLRAFAAAVGKESADETTKYNEFLFRFAETEPRMLAYFESQFAQVVQGRVRKATFPDLPQLHRLVLHTLAGIYNLDSESIGKAIARQLVVRHLGAGVKPAFPQPLLSEAYIMREQERKRARGLNSVRTLIIHVASRAKDPATMSLETRVERELRAHMGAYKVLGRATMSSKIVGVSVEFSTLERSTSALASLKERAGVTVEPMGSNAQPKPEKSDTAYASIDPDSTWDESSQFDYRLGELRDSLPSLPAQVAADEDVPDSWDD